MKCVVLVVLALAVCVAAGTLQDRAKFTSWKHTHGKTYASAEDEAKAFTNFRATLVRLRSYRSVGSMGLNSLSDLSPEEFRARYLSGYTPAAARIAGDVPVPVLEADDESIAAAPASFDWRTYDSKAVTPVKDQGDCGSCWAFSATEALESQWYLATKKQLVLAPQQTVSCDKVDQGCNGGDLPTAYDYMKGAGVEAEANYPYKSGDSGETGKCKYNKTAVKAHISGYVYAVPPCNDSCADQNKYEDALKVAVAANSTGTHGPAAICVYAEPWQDYTGPEPLDEECESEYDWLDHCVQVVGYNGAAKTPYWIVRNSWGTSWGQQGYIYLKTGINQCGIADEVVLPIAAPTSSRGHRRHL